MFVGWGGMLGADSGVSNLRLYVSSSIVLELLEWIY